jgi:UDP-N-acetylmuramyl pentapeptide synthase
MVVNPTQTRSHSETEVLKMIAQVMNGENGDGIGPIAHHRMELLEHGAITIIDDAYNANPDSMRVALDALQQISVRKNAKAVAILGDMLELGDDSKLAHEQIGQYAREVAQVNCLIGIGEQAKLYCPDYYFESLHQLKLPEILTQKNPTHRDNVVYLLKASSACKLWEVIAQLVN